MGRNFMQEVRSSEERAEKWEKFSFAGFLEPRQYKNDSIQSKLIPTLKLPRFFITYTRKKCGNFIIEIIFDRMESFLLCLCSSKLPHFFHSLNFFPLFYDDHYRQNSWIFAQFNVRWCHMEISPTLIRKQYNR